MRVVVDTSRCVGHGMCEAAAPDAFEVNDDGYVTVDHAAVTNLDDAVARAAVAACPSAALSLDPES
ncbi:ferredoxin [Rhodococcus gannanensis]|uniref:Ferredoxin n=1 Tax=Rhodococcus gannanensis TaxID=1960308 RepID=A0ABW4P659_9NOCA